MAAARKRYKRSKPRKWLIKLSAVFLVVAVACILHVRLNVNPVIRTVSEEAVRAMTIDAVNEAAALVMAHTVGYDDIIKMQKNDAGDIVMITANPLVINEMARSVTLLAQSKLKQSSTRGVSIPIGSLSGIAFLAGKGKEVNFQALPVGSAESEFVSEFKTMGINQTLHRIYMNVNTNVSVVIPGMEVSVKTVTDVLIAESVIVGKVPDTYLQSSVLSEMLNLVP